MVSGRTLRGKRGQFRGGRKGAERLNLQPWGISLCLNFSVYSHWKWVICAVEALTPPRICHTSAISKFKRSRIYSCVYDKNQENDSLCQRARSFL